jgi:hypothetical protein
MTNKKKRKGKIDKPLSLGNAAGQNMRTNKEKNPEKGVHLRTTPLTTLKVFASVIESMLTSMMRV